MRYGYPLAFVEAETTLDPPSGWNGTVALDPWEYPTQTNLDRLFLSWMIVAALPLAAVWWHEKRKAASGPSAEPSRV